MNALTSIRGSRESASSDRPQYVVFAGVNGAGKSTLYRSKLWRRSNSDNGLARINPDEILKESGADPSSFKAQVEAGKKALALVEKHLEKRQSFNQETTLTGRTALARLKRAHESGYEIRLYYVGVDSPETAVARVHHRANMGGHFIADEDVRRRFDGSLSNFAQCLDFCDEVRVYDNTEELTRIAAWRNGTLCWWSGRKAATSWLARAMKSENRRQAE